MRNRLALAAMLLPLAGCVVPPTAPYSYYPYYPQPGYPGAYSDTTSLYPGYAYNGGSPTIFADGGTWPLIFYGGGWGYWDGYHQWHRAPDRVWRHLEERHPGGTGYRPWGGGGVVPHESFPAGGRAFAPSPGFHPGPSGAPGGGFRPSPTVAPGASFRPGQPTGGPPRVSSPAPRPAQAADHHDRRRDEHH